IVAFLSIKRVSAQAKRPVEVGTLAKGKAQAGKELPYAVKKGADIAKAEDEKKYKSIDEAMAEVKGKESGDEGSEASDAEPGDDAGESDK
ncbi:MAG: hypothetical protein GYA24_11290, partial [Candidatus Lokiarchaeota archaeon]|nr:hypothetical protein [Candidatus Lokiarchaeota archaeon]